MIAVPLCSWPALGPLARLVFRAAGPQPAEYSKVVWQYGYVHAPVQTRTYTRRLWAHVASCGASTALHLAALQGNTIEMSRIFTECKVDIDAEESYGHHTALHLAVKGMWSTRTLLSLSLWKGAADQLVWLSNSAERAESSSSLRNTAPAYSLGVRAEC